MLDLTHLGQPLKNQQIIYANSTTSGSNWVSWTKPRNINFLNLFLLAGGGGGGAGAIPGTVSNSAGGAGGASSSQFNATFNLNFLPETLYISVGVGGSGGNAGTGGAGVSSYVSISPNTTSNNLLAAAAAGGGGADGSSTGDLLAAASSGLAGKFFNGTSWRTTISTGNIGTLPLTTTNESSNITSTGTLPSAAHATGVNIWTSINYSTIGESYGFIAIGYFKPPTTGNYYFRTSSDDGSGVWLGDIATATSGRTTANATVNNGLGNGQGNTTVGSSAVSLTAGVWYAIRIVHEEGTGGDNLTFQWSSDNVNWSTDLSQYFKAPPVSGTSYDYITTNTGTLTAGVASGIPGNSISISELNLFGLAVSTTHIATINGQSGGVSGTTGSPVDVTLPLTGLVVTAGAGGAGIGSGAGFTGGGFIVPSNTVFPAHTGGLAGTSTSNGGNGGNGFQAIPKLLYFYGGAGGGSGGTSATTSGGNGGAGSFGCGGGGGGGGAGGTRSLGGRGGDGLCILTYW